MRPRAVITGGSGFVGNKLAIKLVEEGFTPVLVDVAPPFELSEINANEFEFHQVDIRDEEALERVFKDSKIVFHVASYGMSGSAQLNRRMVRQVNVQGTRNVVHAAVRCCVDVLVVTSTYNVVFGGAPIDGGDETYPYYPLGSHVDEYSRSKAESEMLVLAANGTRLVNEKVMKTCAIRPAAIWGKGETRHMARVMRYIEKGLFFFRFGDRKAKMDFVHVDNLVTAHILAYRNLKEGSGSAAGNAYFISDGEEAIINNFDFFGQLATGLGYSGPVVSIPIWIVYFCALLMEILHHYIHGFEPLLTRAEVLKSGVCHWFRIEKARRDLLYQPKKYSFVQVLEQFEGHSKSSSSSIHEKFLYFCWKSIVYIMVMIALLGLLLLWIYLYK